MFGYGVEVVHKLKENKMSLEFTFIDRNNFSKTKFELLSY